MKKIILSTLVSSMLLTNIVASDTINPTSKEVSTKATQIATKKANDNKVKLAKEALTSLELTTKALDELNKNNIDKAKKDIELSLGKLEAILAAENTPKLLPIENNIIVKNFIGTDNDVQEALNNVKTLLSQGKVQEAGELLITLQSEIDITIVNLPLATYPDALKLASKYIIEDKPQKAKEVLKLALNTFTEVKMIVPIPLINIIQLVNVAAEIAKDDKKQALIYLASASDELDKAEKLGYLSESTTSYKQLHTMIKNVEKEIKGSNKAEKLFEKLSEKLKEFKEKIFSSNSKKSKK
jgi:hypothetical protein